MVETSACPEYHKCIDYRHVVGLLVAKDLRSAQAVRDAHYEERGSRTRQSELRLKITMNDLHTDNTVYSYGLGPLCGVPWILGLPMGKVGLEGQGSWELSETRSSKVLDKGAFSVDSGKTVGLYYSTTQHAYAAKGVIGQSLSGVAASIADGVVKALARQPRETEAALP